MTKERLTSLDVFRGITIMLMTIVNNPGSWGGAFILHWNTPSGMDVLQPI